jgi:uncharacterized protein (UPF0248 family)
MATIKEVIDRIRWDNSLKQDQFRFYYLDRLTNKLREIKYSDIKKIDGTFIILEKEGEEAKIPMHRFKRVTKGGFLFWKRDYNEEKTNKNDLGLPKLGI